ncbi:glutathione synthase [Entomomonas asaccharolytica]|uniref:Glutathione synthetase n=1 Tax=Entomomonas asaccharolytica TaxID=2785331 RepID=A0A974NFV7_9GAMM|nr:glutathione synthase [Entomomonas asaccharolytica]QQP85779.1 glutathione synthase [Entomomonas asaccharolytica]
MSIRLGIVMDPINSINFKKDSSLAMLWAAQERGWELFYMQQEDLYLLHGMVRAKARSLKVYKQPEHFYDLGEEADISLDTLNVILMRKDPPFNSEFLYTTYLLEKAEQQGVLIVNKPQSLRDCNEKLFATNFAEFMVPTLVSRRPDILKAFIKEQGDVILKPLDEMGGASIFRHREGDPNLSVIIETLTAHGTRQTMVQRYIPDITAGDKRILIVDGEPIPYCLARVPAKGETRGNLAAGGTGIAQPLSEKDYAIAKAIGPELQKRGLLFVGLDIIGEYVTEVNVTSPTCIREIDKAYNTDIAGKLMNCIEAKLKK